MQYVLAYLHYLTKSAVSLLGFRKLTRHQIPRKQDEILKGKKIIVMRS